jgi:hypothetical protein
MVEIATTGQRRFVPRASTRLTTNCTSRCKGKRSHANHPGLLSARARPRSAPTACPNRVGTASKAPPALQICRAIRVRADALRALRGSPLQGLRVSFDTGPDALRALRGSPLQGLRVSFDAGADALRALWGSPLQGLRVSFDAGADARLAQKIAPYSYHHYLTLYSLLFTHPARVRPHKESDAGAPLSFNYYVSILRFVLLFLACRSLGGGYY